MLTKIRNEIAPTLSRLTQLSEKDIVESLELPKKLEHGHLAFPVFALAKSLRKAPPQIAQEMAERVRSEKLPILAAVEPVGGYVNFKFHDKYLQDILADAVHQDKIGFSTLGQGKTLVIDYSSPNVAKPMGIGHLRATMIGQAVRNLGETQGYKIIGINHLGDWGVQFGKLAWAYVNWGHEYPFKEQPFDSLLKLYTRFHAEAETNPELDQEGSLYFKRLEGGDPEIRKIWKMFLEITIAENEKLYKLLGVKFDLIQGEAFYEPYLVPTVKKIKDAGILQESEGAQVVFLDETMPPCLIMKSDGTSLYATRDIASAIYRKEDLKGDLILYVVGVDQTLHFKQVFGVLSKMGYKWAENCKHIAFGMYRFGDLKMSTRRGNVIFMEDVLMKAVDLVDQMMLEKNPTLENRKEIAEKVAVGAVIFNDLMNDRIKNVDFNWEKALNFEGDSGPYVQYCGVRCNSLIKKYGKKIPNQMPIALEADEERELVRLLLNYSDTLRVSFENFKPNILAQYLLEVCRAFSHFYHKHRILGEASQVETSRMVLVNSTHQIVQSGLAVLGIQLPEMM